MDVKPVTLEGDTIRLEPLSMDHLEDLQAAGSDPGIFRWFSAPLDTPAAMREWVETAIEAKEAGSQLPFATVHQDSGRAIGSTRFANIDRDNRHVEIGWTWLAPSHQRTAANTEAKYLQLSHAFEAWDCLRVEFKTDSRNWASRRALERIGATEEGTFRQHVVTDHQGLRDSVYFSILDLEWPGVKRDLEAHLSREDADESS